MAQIHTSDFVGYIAGTSTTAKIGQWANKPSIKIYYLNLNNITTGVNLTDHVNGYKIGSIEGIYPLGAEWIRVDCNRADSSSSDAKLVIVPETANNRSSIYITPLEDVPAHVALTSFVMFFYA